MRIKLIQKADGRVCGLRLRGRLITAADRALPNTAMRLRVALRSTLSHNAQFTPAELQLLIEHVKTVDQLASHHDHGARQEDRLTCRPAPPTTAARALGRDGTINILFSGHGLFDAVRAEALLPTGLEALDRLLGGGIATGEVTELLGAPASGKTQLCLLACAAQAAAARGCGSLYLHTGGAFDASRVWQLLLAQANITPQTATTVRAQYKARLGERVRALAAPRLPELLSELEQLDLQLTSATEEDEAHPSADAAWLRSLRLLVVDSAFGALVAEHHDASTTSVMQARLQQKLRELACRHRLAVLVTNAVHCNKTDLPIPHAPLGHAWQHAAHTRLVLSKEGGDATAQRGLVVGAEVLKRSSGVAVAQKKESPRRTHSSSPRLRAIRITVGDGIGAVAS